MRLIVMLAAFLPGCAAMCGPEPPRPDLFAPRTPETAAASRRHIEWTGCVEARLQPPIPVRIVH